MAKIQLRFMGVDYWDRCVFQSQSGNFYKTIELMPSCGWDALSLEDKHSLLCSVHDSCPFDDPEGEPNCPVPFEYLELIGEE